ncbi:MAG: universal stress protein [Chlorobiaceae bacterium]
MKILAAIDFSPLADKVIAETGKLAGSLGAELFLLHVVPPSSPVIEPAEDELVLLPAEPSRTTGAESGSESEKLKAIAERFLNSGIATTIIIAHKEEVEAIISQGEKIGADMIILGSHGHGALFHLLIGSVSEGVIRRATCPVVIIPASMR